jgi:hypothetical protein
VATRRLTVGGEALTLDLGTLDTGLYAVRVIGAVDQEVGRFTEPLFMRMTVNDRADGSTSSYRKRCGYVDQFYSLQEFYFHAPVKRAYRAEIVVDRGSTVAPLVHTVSLDDVLAGSVRKALKTQSTVAEPPTRIDRSKLPLSEERLAQDALIWRGLPSANAQGADGRWAWSGHFQSKADCTRFGVDGKTKQQIETEHGSWRAPRGVGDGLVFMRNDQAGLVYTVDMLHRGEPLPAPYPFADDGAGLWEPDDDNPDRGEAWTPVGDVVFARRRDYGSGYKKDAEAWSKNGSALAARRAAMTLARIAYQCPTIDTGSLLECAGNIPASYGRDSVMRRRATGACWLSHYPNYHEPPAAYDRLFTYIDGNEELAQSIGRFVPWVKTSKDVIELLDVYLVQSIAKRILRYHYHTGPMQAANVALYLGNKGVADPWIDWVFARTFVYPLPVGGIQDLMISGCDRSGPEYVGSTFYSQGEGAGRVAASLERFRQLGLLPEKYDLTNNARYPKPLAHCYWHLGIVIAGQEFPRIGDVCGADKVPGHTMRNFKETARNGWLWGKDPKFAWLLRHLVGRGDSYEDAEWAEIEAAAATLARAPWLDNRSRQIYNWAGVLETGHQHDDWRFRRAAYLRTGAGMGHHHDDSLDLQLVAHGLPMTVDGGQRPGYCSPGSRTTRVHNLVEVNGSGHRGQSWVRALNDAPGARYLEADGMPPAGSSLFRRQIALIDVDEGRKSQPLTLDQQKPFAALPKDVLTGNSYVVDVFRVAGGHTHTYCFHGMVNDALDTNIADLKPVSAPADGAEPSAEYAYLRIFSKAPDRMAAGTLPATLTATWRYSRDSTHGSEQRMAGKNFDGDSPRKYTKLHLLGVEGLTGMRGRYVCNKLGYWFDNIFAQRRAPEGGNLDSAFAAVIEPYADQPFVTETALLTVADNEADASRAVAVRVKTRNGHTDITFMDGRPDKIRRVGDVTIAGESAFYGVDADGLRVAVLTGGTLLRTPHVELTVAARALTGTVTAADYAARTATIDAVWPAAAAGDVFEIGTDRRTTSYTLTNVVAGRKTTVLSLQGGADYLRSQVAAVDEKNGIVTCQVVPSLRKLPGLDLDFTASNDDGSKRWRADYIDNGRWQLSGDPVSAADFSPSRAMRVWEYGVGDRVRLSASAWIKRAGQGVYEVGGNADLTVALPAESAELSTDGGKTWRALTGKRADGRTAFNLTAATRGGKTCLLRVAMK